MKKRLVILLIVVFTTMFIRPLSVEANEENKKEIAYSSIVKGIGTDGNLKLVNAEVIDGIYYLRDLTRSGSIEVLNLDKYNSISIPSLEMPGMSVTEEILNFDHLPPHFFETNFWYMCQTTFAFQKWSSVSKLKRYMERMIFEFSRIETLEGVKRIPYDQYDSLIVPLKA